MSAFLQRNGLSADELWGRVGWRPGEPAVAWQGEPLADWLVPNEPPG